VSIRNSNAEYNHTLWTSEEFRDTEVFRPFFVAMLVQHAMAIDVSDDGWTDILGFYPNGTLFCTKVGDKGTIRPAVDYCEHEFAHFQEQTNVYPGMPHLFVDLNNDLFAEIVFLTKGSDGSLVFNVWQKTKLNWSFREWIPKITPSFHQYVAAPVVMDYDSDGQMDILVPVCKEAACTHITQMTVWSKDRQWMNVACEMQDFSVKKDPYSMVVFRV
uniref:Uncharacterized protein n=2 Tax=Caenorhabditis japonica TaxID=281687 RepID=A0A8R1EPR7_CAEJA